MINNKTMLYFLVNSPIIMSDYELARLPNKSIKTSTMVYSSTICEFFNGTSLFDPINKFQLLQVYESYKYLYICISIFLITYYSIMIVIINPFSENDHKKNYKTIKNK